MPAQVFKFPSDSATVASASLDTEVRTEKSVDVVFLAASIFFASSIAFAFFVLYRLYGFGGVAVFVAGVGLIYSILRSLATVTLVAPSETPVVVPEVAPETKRFFQELESFRWNFEEEFKFYSDKKLFWKERRIELFARANTDELKKMLKDFRAFHYAGAPKPVLSNYR